MPLLRGGLGAPAGRPRADRRGARGMLRLAASDGRHPERRTSSTTTSSDEVLAELQAKPTTRAEDILSWVPDYWRHYEEQATQDDPQLDPSRSRGGIDELELAIDVHGRRLQRPGETLPVNVPNAGSGLPGFPDSLVVETLGRCDARRHPPAAACPALPSHLQGLVEALGLLPAGGGRRGVVGRRAATPCRRCRRTRSCGRSTSPSGSTPRWPRRTGRSCRSGWPQPEVRGRARARGPRSRSVEGVTAPPRNLVNLKAVDKGYGSRSVLRDVTLGVAAGDRIGVVGRNGDGKSTLLRLIAGVEDARRRRGHARRRRSTSALLGQGDDLDAERTDPRRARRRPRRPRVGGRRRVPRRARRAARRRRAAPLRRTGSTRRSRRCRAASGGASRSPALLLDRPELLLLDEPTNHLDVEGVDWLARHLAAPPRRRSLVVTHDRWFLDAVCTATWEVADGAVHQYEGGYAAYVLARAERDRQAAAREDRRRQLLRKELAWLRRGPPARTSKPKFRIEAANALIADEPEPRDRAELLRFATRAARRQGARRRGRLGRLRRPARSCATSTWRLGPGRPRRRSSASTARARRRCSTCSRASSQPDAGRGRARRDGARSRTSRQDTAEIPGPPARARGARGDPRPDRARRRARAHRRRCCASASASAATRPARSCATSPAASAGGCS